MTETQLDWAVAKAIGKKVKIINGKVHDAELLEMDVDGDTVYSPTRNWVQGGPLLDTYMIHVARREDSILGWINKYWCPKELGGTEHREEHIAYGKNYLEAGMQVLVKARLGSNIKFPEELK